MNLSLCASEIYPKLPHLDNYGETWSLKLLKIGRKSPLSGLWFLKTNLTVDRVLNIRVAQV
jgi:hypothetical protein